MITIPTNVVKIYIFAKMFICKMGEWRPIGDLSD